MNIENKNMTLWDLQLFADASTQLQNTTATTGMKPEIKTYYERRLIELAEPKLVHDQFGDSYPIPTTALTEGVTPEGQAMTVTTITAEVKQYGGWVPVTDVLQMAALDNNIVQATKLLASQAGRTLDAIVRDVMVGGTNVIYAPKIAAGTGATTEVTQRTGLDATSVLTPDLIFQAATVLGAMNTDTIGDSYVAIVHPYEEWIDVHKYADPEAIFNGEIGKLGNVRFVQSSEAKIWKDSTCPSDGASGNLAVFATMVLGAHAYASTELEGGGLEHIVKQLGYGDDPLNQRASVGWKAIKTAERLVEQYMVRIESTSAYSKKASAN